MADNTYLLRMSTDQVHEFAHQLMKEDATDCCKALGKKLSYYLSPHPAGYCAACGKQLGSESYVSPESEALTEVVLEGFRAVEAQSRIVCKRCLRQYYLNRGDNDPFPDLVES